MTWLRLDDGFPQHPKIVQLARGERWTWLEILAYCARYRTDGNVPKSVREAVPAATPKLLAKLVGLRLLDEAEHGWIVHDWDDYNPSDVSNADRQRRWRNAHRNVTRNGERNDSERNAGVTVTAPRTRASAPVPVPSPTPQIREGVEGSSNGSSAVRPERATPDFTTPLELDPEKELAIAKFRRLKFSDDKTVDVVRHKYGHLPVAAFHSALESAAAKGNSIEYAMGALRSMVAEGQYQ